MIALVVAVFLAVFAAIAAVILLSDHYRDRREAARDARPMYTPAPAAHPSSAAGAGAITGVVMVYHPEPGPLELAATAAAAIRALPLDDYLNHLALHTGYRDRPPMEVT